GQRADRGPAAEDDRLVGVPAGLQLTAARPSATPKVSQRAFFSLSPLRGARVGWWRFALLPQGRRASASRSLALGIRSCLLTLRKPIVSSGQAMKIDEAVPITMPIICASAMPSSDPPPYR